MCWPAAAIAEAPVYADTRPAVSIIATCRPARCSSAFTSCVSASGALTPPRISARPRGAVSGIDERLRGDGADPRLGPGHDGPDREPVRLHGHAHLSGGRVARDDGVGVHERVGESPARESVRRQQTVAAARWVRVMPPTIPLCRALDPAGPWSSGRASGRPVCLDRARGARRVRRTSQAARARARGRHGAV